MGIHADAPEVADPLEVGRLRDPHGVLTIYVDADPREQAAARPSWVVSTENGLREIRERVKSKGDRALWTAVFDRLDELEPEISNLLDPRRPGRGRALFATIDGGVLRTAGLHLPLTNRVVLDDIAHLTPLVAALDRGRPVGILAVSHSDVRVLERRLGLVDEVTAVSLEPDTSEWREMKGPAAANPALAQHAAPQHDRFERRLEEHRVQALEAATKSLEDLSARRGWDSILVAGERRLADRLAAAFSREGMDVAVVDRSLGMLAPGDILAAVAPELEAAVVRREALLVTRARDAALSGNAGAVGLADVLTALDEGRVGHLLFDEDRSYAGARTPDGRLVPAGVVPPGVEATQLVEIPSLAGHLVERALATDARVTPLSAASTEAIAEYDGVAALLRW
ncbi:MAG: VLRF1 family aeRF1-type release factor [Gaiellaceae bacterium]